MHDTARVCIRQRVGDLPRESDGVVNRQLTLALESRAQRLAFDVRHHVVQQPTGAPGVEQRQDVRVLQVRRQLDLAQKPFGAE